MEYFKDGRRKKRKSDLDFVVDQDFRKLAEKIVEIGNLTDPSVKEFPNDPDEAAKLLLERVLIPKPDYRTGNGIRNAFRDDLDTAAAERILATRGLLPTDSPFVDLSRYRQVKVFWEFVEPGRIRHRKGGWVFKLVSNFHGDYGGVERVVRKRTRVYLRRTEAAIEMTHLLARYTQEIDIPK